SHAPQPPQARGPLLPLEKTQTLAAVEETTPNLTYTVKLELNESLGDLTVGPDRKRFWRVVPFALAQNRGVAYFPRRGSVISTGSSDSRFQLIDG
ncbi:MAG: hypothetical protein ABSG86_27045, partial [Thermoguttaceae bacterium]